MLRLTKQTDYALVLLGLLARDRSGRPRTARGLAKAAGIPLPMVSKILKLLSREKLLKSERGASGGYRLSRQASEITVGEVILLMEGPIALTDCSSAVDANCAIEPACPVTSTMRRVNGIVIETLESISLEDMVRPRQARVVGLEATEPEDGAAEAITSP